MRWVKAISRKSYLLPIYTIWNGLQENIDEFLAESKESFITYYPDFDCRKNTSKALTEKIVAKTLPDQDGSLVYIPNIKNLTFSLAPSTSLPNGENSLTDVNNISFNLSGNLKIVWIVDEDKVITDMLGKRKNNFNQILAEYPNIDSAQLVLRPFWKRFFPKKAKDIQTIVNYPE